MTLEIHSLDGREAIATIGSVVLRVIDGAPTDTDVLDRFAARTQRVLERSSFVGMWIVVHHGSPPPTMAVSRYAARVLEAQAHRSSTVYSMLGLGFWAATARAATSMVNTMLRSSSHVEDSVEAGAARLAQELVGLNSDELVAGYELVRTKMLQAQAGEAVDLAVHTPEPPESSLSPSASMSRVGERSMIRRFRIVADRELCQGHGMCAAEAPELFRVVDDKVCISDPEPDPKLWFKAEAATRYCPQFALTIEELE